MRRLPRSLPPWCHTATVSPLPKPARPALAATRSKPRRGSLHAALAASNDLQSKLTIANEAYLQLSEERALVATSEGRLRSELAVVSKEVVRLAKENEEAGKRGEQNK